MPLALKLWATSCLGVSKKEAQRKTKAVWLQSTNSDWCAFGDTVSSYIILCAAAEDKVFERQVMAVPKRKIDCQVICDSINMCTRTNLCSARSSTATAIMFSKTAVLVCRVCSPLFCCIKCNKFWGHIPFGSLHIVWERAARAFVYVLWVLQAEISSLSF